MVFAAILSAAVYCTGQQAEIHGQQVLESLRTPAPKL